MIDFVEGTLERVESDFAVVRVGGVGLRLYVPAGTQASLPAPGETVRLHAHLYVREDTLALYGFAERAELALFELFMTVSGVGARLALAILAAAPPDHLASAIASGDESVLVRVPGVGQRTAARIILELKNKVAAVPVLTSPDDGELLAALATLGYSVNESSAAIRALPPDPAQALEERLRLALSYLSPQRDGVAK